MTSPTLYCVLTNAQVIVGGCSNTPLGTYAFACVPSGSSGATESYFMHTLVTEFGKAALNSSHMFDFHTSTWLRLPQLRLSTSGGAIRVHAHTAFALKSHMIGVYGGYMRDYSDTSEGVLMSERPLWVLDLDQPTLGWNLTLFAAPPYVSCSALRKAHAFHTSGSSHEHSMTLNATDSFATKSRSATL